MENSKFLIRIGVVVFVGIILVAVLSSTMFYTIEAGHQGVIFRKFGGGVDPDVTLEEGFHVIAPWNSVYPYDIRIQEVSEEMDVLAENGLNIHVELSLRFRAHPGEVAKLHKEIGREYREKIVVPEIRSSTRNVIGKYLPEELYSSRRGAIQDEILEMTRKGLQKYHVDVEAVLIRSVQLPQQIQGAIEAKLKQEQQSMEYEFRIEKEKKEAERKRIEAQGIKDFQDIVSEGISEKLLKWKGIEATQDLAKSPNSKIIVIGSGGDELPVILNGN